MKILAASIHVPVGDWSKCLSYICEIIDQAVKEKCSILAFSELSLTSIDARDYLKNISNTQICSYLRLIACYANSKNPTLKVFIGHPWQGHSADDLEKKTSIPLSSRDKLWNAYSCLYQNDIFGMSLKQYLDDYSSRLEERDYIGAKKIGLTQLNLPETTLLMPNGNKIFFPKKIIQAGNCIFSFKEKEYFNIYPVIGDQNFLKSNYIDEIKTHILNKKNIIILNPSATPSNNTVKKQHKRLIKMSSLLSVFYIRINSLGGINNGQGDILACKKGEIKTQILSSPFTEKNAVLISTRKSNNPIHPYFSPKMLSIRSQVRWLFDYLTNTNMSKMTISILINGDMISIYHVYLIYFMIKWHLNDLKLDALLKKLGIFEKKEEIIHESKNHSIEKTILSHILICIFIKNNLKNINEEKNIKKWVNSIGANFVSCNSNSLILETNHLIPIKFNADLKKDLDELADTVISLSISNYKQSINLANFCIDDLILHPRFGGKIHQGQINPSGCFYKTEISELMHCISNQAISSFEKNIIKKQLIDYKSSKESEKDAYFKIIAKNALNINKKKPHPIHVFLACKKEKKFLTIKEEELLNNIIYFYNKWSQSQYAIHSSPLTLNHNQQSIEHNMGKRTPNISSFQREEIAQLIFFFYFKNKISKIDYDYLFKKILINKELINTLFLCQKTKKIPSISFLLKKSKKNEALNEKIKKEKKPINYEKIIGLKITQASCNQTSGAWENNIKNILYAIDMAVKDESDLLCLPELSLTGYDCGDNFFSIENETTWILLEEILDYAFKKDPNLLISIGHTWKLPLEKNPITNPNNKPFNVQSLLGKDKNGEMKVLMMKFKGDLYGEGRGFERRYFAYELDKDEMIYISSPKILGKKSYKIPFGRKLVASIGNEKQGYFNFFQSICEEIWKRSEYDDSSGKYYRDYNIIGELKNEGHNIDLYVSAHASPPSPEKFKKQIELTKLASTYGAKNMLAIYTDSLGSSGSSYVNAGGRFAAQNGNLIVDSPGIYSFKSVVYNTHTFQISFRKLNNKKTKLIVKHDFKNSLEEKTISPDPWRKKPEQELEASIRNQLLFIYDIMKKSQVRCFTQALSGGADSAWNALKIRLMIELGIKELGASSFLESLNYSKNSIKKIISLKNYSKIVFAIMKKTLICYYLATKNNSSETEEAARSLIEGTSLYSGIGGSFLKLNIQPLIENFSFVLLNLNQSPKNKIKILLSYISQLLNLQSNEEGKKNYIFIEKELKNQFGNWSGVLLSPSIASLGLTIENAQARIRQMITSFLTKIMSNHPHILHQFFPKELTEITKKELYDQGTCFGLSNPNENEGRRAYTTFGGDLHSGEINLNGHLPKNKQLEEMQYIYHQGLNGLSPIKSLDLILNQTPSAELQPKNKNNEVVQTDEKAFGLRFEEATIINHAKEKYHCPIKIMKSCQNHAIFCNQNIATIHNKIYISYHSFPIALHKLIAAPNMQTYGEYTTSAKSSMQYPLISVYEKYELAELTLFCLKQLAKENNIKFKKLTGYAYSICKSLLYLDRECITLLNKAMHTPDSKDGLPYKLETLFEKLKNNPLFIFSAERTPSWNKLQPHKYLELDNF